MHANLRLLKPAALLLALAAGSAMPGAEQLVARERVEPAMGSPWVSHGASCYARHCAACHGPPSARDDELGRNAPPAAARGDVRARTLAPSAVAADSASRRAVHGHGCVRCHEIPVVVGPAPGAPAGSPAYLAADLPALR